MIPCKDPAKRVGSVWHYTNPQKDNLMLPDDYRGISLTQVTSKVYNRLLLNKVRPLMDSFLHPNQNAFRQLPHKS